MFSLKLFSRLFGSRPAAPEEATLDPALLAADWLVVGLGNPGARYAPTRHNVGYMAVDDLLADSGGVLVPVKGLPVAAAPLDLEGVRALVLRSTTFMNLSGEAVAPLAERLGVPAERIVVVHDELDLPAGRVRVKVGGNENGHNGLKSISELLGTRDYPRVRIGISRPPKGVSVSDHVLGPVDAGAELDEAIATAAEAVRLVVTRGVSAAQNVIHAR